MASHWKNRYTEKQLEKKRLADRLSQRRIRNTSKRAVTELKERLQLSLSGNHATLIQRLQDENAKLKSTISRYRSCFEDITTSLQECVEDDTDSENAKARKNTSSATNLSLSERDTTAPPTQMMRLIPSYESIYPRNPNLVQPWSFSGGPGVSMNRIVESVIEWKLSNHHGFGSRFLVDLLGLDGPKDFFFPPDETEQRISSTSFYRHLIKALTDNIPLPLREDQIEEDGLCQLPPSHISYGELERRMINLYAYENLRKWLPLFASQHESSAIFWSVFKYLEFLTFPSIETLQQVPYFLWPTPTQFSRDHPGFIDFLIWPRLRDALVLDWNQRELDSFMCTLVQNFKLKRTENIPRESIFRLAQARMQIELDFPMAEVVYNLENYSMRADFAQMYPDLAIHIAIEADIIQVAPSSGVVAPKRSFAACTLDQNPSTGVSSGKASNDVESGQARGSTSSLCFGDETNLWESQMSTNVPLEGMERLVQGSEQAAAHDLGNVPNFDSTCPSISTAAWWGLGCPLLWTFAEPNFGST